LRYWPNACRRSKTVLNKIRLGIFTTIIGY
jgi:hypothetical protein